MLEFDSQSETGYIVPSTVPQIGSDFTMSSPAALMEVASVRTTCTGSQERYPLIFHTQKPRDGKRQEGDVARYHTGTTGNSKTTTIRKRFGCASSYCFMIHDAHIYGCLLSPDSALHLSIVEKQQIAHMRAVIANLLCLLLCAEQLSAFPYSKSPTRIRRHGSTTIHSFAELFPNDGRPYVPSGLTEEEYNRIKDTEAERVSKLNYGAWGPRFKPSGTPNGDWFVVPQLWTSGFQALKKDPSNNIHSRKNRLATFLVAIKQKLPRFLLAYMLFDAILGIVSSRCSYYHYHKTLWQAAVSPIVLFGRHTLALTRISLFWSLLAKATLSIAFTPSVERFVEWASRKRLWTSRRVMTTCALSIITTSCLVSSLAFLLAKLF